MRKCCLVIGTLIVSLVMPLSTVQAFQLRHHGGLHKIERVVDDLVLSTVQRQSVYSIIDAARADVRDLRPKMKENRKQLRTYVKNGSTDEQQLIEFGAVVGQLAGQSVVNRVRLLRDIREVLTEDQRVEAERLFKRMRRHGHKDKDKDS